MIAAADQLVCFRASQALSYVMALSLLQRLEAESVHLLREVVAESERPVMLYALAKDSAVLLRLAEKAFHPGPLPFPLLQVDSIWNFRDAFALRERFGCDALIAGVRGDQLKAGADAQALALSRVGKRAEPHTDERPELWHVLNLRKHSGDLLRANPLSNWTEPDVRQYIELEKIRVAPLDPNRERLDFDQEET